MIPDKTFFRSLGVFVAEGFLSPTECAELRSIIREAPSRPSEVGYAEPKVYEEVRRTLSARPAEEVRQAYRERMLGLLPELEKHFDVSLLDVRSDFLRYGEGDRFIPHCDIDEAERELGDLCRKVSAVVFLNAPANDGVAGGFTGGDLILYNLLEVADSDHFGFPVTPEEGLLVAFRSDLLHQVTEIESGERLSIVSWFN